VRRKTQKEKRRRITPLYYGENADILRQNVKDDTVDLICLDSPFNSNQNCRMVIREKGVASAVLQIQAFGDTQTWHPQDEVFHALS